MSAASLARLLSADRGLLFRITHKDNLRHLLENGVHCAQSHVLNPSFVSIGNPELIVRPSRSIPAGPGGTLAEYVPFYFTPYSPMLYNIVTGYKGLQQRSRAEILILVTSLKQLDAHDVRYVVADRHAYLSTAEFWEDRARCVELPWDLWQARNFQRNPNDPSGFERYQAEVLVYRHLPLSSLQGIIVYDERIEEAVGALIQELNCTLTVRRRPGWYP